MDQKDMDFLRSVLFAERVTAQGQSARITGIMSSGIKKGARALVKVLSTRKFPKSMKYAHNTRFPCSARTRTGLVGASVALHGGIMLDFCAMKSFP